MSRGPRHRVAFRRRRDGLTDYRSRLALLKSGKARAVVRLSRGRIVVAITAYDPVGDRIVAARRLDRARAGRIPVVEPGLDARRIPHGVPRRTPREVGRDHRSGPRRRPPPPDLGRPESKTRRTKRTRQDQLRGAQNRSCV